MTTLIDQAFPSGVATVDPATLTIREAVQLADMASGSQTLSIWLPAWQFVLTLDRGNHTTDIDPAYGDLDITHNLMIRGVIFRPNPMQPNNLTVMTKVSWKPNVSDAVFELLGDYNGNGAVEAADYVQWHSHLNQQIAPGTNGDGDDNGMVDQSDYNLWMANYGNTLLTININFG